MIPIIVVACCPVFKQSIHADISLQKVPVVAHPLQPSLATAIFYIYQNLTSSKISQLPKAQRTQPTKNQTMLRINTRTLTILLWWIGPTWAEVQDVRQVNHNISRDLVVGLSVAGAATLVFLVVVCTCAHCGPWLVRRCCCGDRSRSGQHWFRTGGDEKLYPLYMESRSDIRLSHA